MTKKKKKEKILSFFYKLLLLIFLSVLGTLENIDITNIDYKKIPFMFSGIFLGLLIKFFIKPLIMAFLEKKNLLKSKSEFSED